MGSMWRADVVSGLVVHRLGVVLCMAGLSAWTVGLARQGWRARRARRRARAVLAAPARPERPRGGVQIPPALRKWLPVAGAGCAGYVLAGGVPGLLLGAVAAGAVWRWRVRGGGLSDLGGSTGVGGIGAGIGAGSGGREEAVRQLPLAAELLAACLAAGADPVGAASAVGESLDGPVGRALARGAAQLRLGAESALAWRELAAVPGADGLVRLLRRAGESGAPAAVPVARFAAECRAERGRRATAVARRAAVVITAPVGLCFLPAFLVVGVVPVVIGLAGGVLR
jgi:hypothetical protein